MRIGIVCVVVAWAGLARAAPASPVAAKVKQAAQLQNSGQYAQALGVIEEGLAIAPNHVPLLDLKGSALLRLKDYLGALEAYEACVAAGATGAVKQTALKIIAQLRPVRLTFLDVTVANGPAVIHLDSRTEAAFCTAAPSCHKGWLPGAYKVIAERAGFQTWTGPVTIPLDGTGKVAITLVEKPSPLTVRVAQAGATILVDDTAYTASSSVAAGPHRVTVSLAGHLASRHDVVAHLGEPVELDVSLTPRVAVHLVPATAELRLDDHPISIVDGGLDLPPGAHHLVARAPGFGDRRVEIPAARPAGYAVELVLARPEAPVASASRFTVRREVALAVGGGGLVALAAGAVLGVQAKHLDRDAYARCPSPATPCAAALEANDLNRRGQARARDANIAYGIAAGAAITAAVLWLTGAPESRVAITPRVGAVAGLDLAVRF